MNDDTDTKQVRIWDAPTRLFHWLLALLILAQYLTGEFDLVDMRWHFWGGYATLALILFRLLWGLFGSQTSRFGEFVRGPSAVTAYIRNRFSSGEKVSVGHNPLGGWSVIALLVVVAAQAVTGLFSSNDEDDAGVLAAHVSGHTVKLLTHWHHLIQKLLLVLIAIHVAAVLLYLLLRHDNLIAPMLSGRRRLASHVPLHFASAWRALALLAVSAAAVAALVWIAG